ncbi:hypothetical protein BpHYR1_025507 [Brachionus plicatilis]|uniref:Uncharacterized protein n=1 Tax=Brachionus plicatilis TaxID=10195 RepID=A0A3M7RBU7_BRAPC|nr:hypothetical protein BpHYR1_025507 [Brachionus plicatilis]
MLFIIKRKLLNKLNEIRDLNERKIPSKLRADFAFAGLLGLFLPDIWGIWDLMGEKWDIAGVELIWQIVISEDYRKNIKKEHNIAKTAFVAEVSLETT